MFLRSHNGVTITKKFSFVVIDFINMYITIYKLIEIEGKYIEDNKAEKITYLKSCVILLKNNDYFANS